MNWWLVIAPWLRMGEWNDRSNFRLFYFTTSRKFFHTANFSKYKKSYKKSGKTFFFLLKLLQIFLTCVKSMRWKIMIDSLISCFSERKQICDFLEAKTERIQFVSIYNRRAHYHNLNSWRDGQTFFVNWIEYEWTHRNSCFFFFFAFTYVEPCLKSIQIWSSCKVIETSPEVLWININRRRESECVKFSIHERCKLEK